MIRKLRKIPVIVVLFGIILNAQPGTLNIGFDLDDTILYSRFTFEKAPKHSTGGVDYGWVNSHDRDYSMLIPPIVDLVRYFTLAGHNVYLITARKGENGERVAEFLSDQLGIQFEVDKNLFFSGSEVVNGRKHTTKHRVMIYLDLDIYYGDSDSDIVAALKAKVHPVRVVRHMSSVLSYGDSYFGNLNEKRTPENPFQMEDLKLFYNARVGLFGESIYPIIWNGPGK